MVDQLLAELDEAAHRKQPPLTAREWRSIATSARKLESVSRRLAERAAELYSASTPAPNPMP